MQTERIQKYLDGDLNEDELKKFREDLKIDPDLFRELDLMRSLETTIISRDEERFRKKLNQAYKAYGIISATESQDNALNQKNKTFKKILISLPVIAGLFIILYFQWFNKESNESIFNKNLTSFSKDLTSRELYSGEGKPGNLEPGIKLFYQNNYSEASRIFTQILYEEPGNADARFYNGLSYIYLNDFENAISSFDFVCKLPFNYYQEYARWYLALCYVRTNNNKAAKDLLIIIIEENHLFSPKAKKVLRRLK